MVEKHLEGWNSKSSILLLHRKRRQSGLPHQLRSRRRRQDRRSQRHRRRRQAAQISRHFPQGGADDPEQDRSAALRAFRAGSGAGERATAFNPEIEIIETSCMTGAGLRPVADAGWRTASGQRSSPQSSGRNAKRTSVKRVHGSSLTMLVHGPSDLRLRSQRGITRRQLVKFCGAMLGTLALPERYLAKRHGGSEQGEESRCWSGCNFRTAPAARSRCCDRAIPSRRCRARTALLGVPRSDHGRRRQTRPTRCWTA